METYNMDEEPHGNDPPLSFPARIPRMENCGNGAGASHGG